MKHLPIIFLLLIQACTPNKLPNAITQDEYDIYSVLINHFVIPALRIYKISDTSCVVLVHHNTIRGIIYHDPSESDQKSKTGRSDTVIGLKKYSTSGEWNLLITNFLKVCNDTVELDGHRFKVPIKCELDSTKNRWKNRRSRNWLAGYSFSRVGFNNKINEAIVYYSADIFEGGGDYTVLLRKENNRWSIVNGIGWSKGWSHDYGYLIIPRPSVGIPIPPPDSKLSKGKSVKDSVP